eukprot:gene28965-32155_t
MQGDMEPAPETVELDGGETNQASGGLTAFERKNRLVSFDSWYTNKVKEITEFTPSSVKVL